MDEASLMLRDVERQTSSMWKKVADQVEKNKCALKKQAQPVESTWKRFKKFLCGSCTRSKSVGSKAAVKHQIGIRRSFTDM